MTDRFERLVGRTEPVFSGLRPGSPARRPMAGGERTQEANDRVALARAFLGLLAEPGDGVMGALVDVLGAETVCRLLLDGADAAEFGARLAGTGAPIDRRALGSGCERWRPRIDPDALRRSLDDAARVDAHYVVPGDEAWPIMLDDLGRHAPLGLWARGDAGLLARSARTIALVGARAASGYGEHVAVESAAGLSDRGFVVVSGGAYGIDGMAHRATLRSDGTTVAFLAGGVDRFYPAGHDSLLTRIVATGAVIAEVPCGTAPTKWRFLQRNRLIAAAASATVVIEAGLRSGSLNTAGHAAALARGLGAVPGPVTSPASAGCHRLLREYDATCVVNADQMAELALGEVAPAPLRPATSAVAAGRASGGPSSHPGAAEAPDGTRILDALSSRTARPTDEVARRAGLEPRRAFAVLGTLEAEGRVARRATGWVGVRPPSGVGPPHGEPRPRVGGAP